MQIYRPSAFKQFSPSRFRMQYVFAKDGACKWMFLSPDDAHHFKDGKWKIDDHVLQIVKEKATESFQVIELSKDLLKMKLLDNAK